MRERQPEPALRRWALAAQVPLRPEALALVWGAVALRPAERSAHMGAPQQQREPARLAEERWGPGAASARTSAVPGWAGPQREADRPAGAPRVPAVGVRLAAQQRGRVLAEAEWSPRPAAPELAQAALAEEARLPGPEVGCAAPPARRPGPYKGRGAMPALEGRTAVARRLRAVGESLGRAWAASPGMPLPRVAREARP